MPEPREPHGTGDGNFALPTCLKKNLHLVLSAEQETLKEPKHALGSESHSHKRLFQAF